MGAFDVELLGCIFNKTACPPTALLESKRHEKPQFPKAIQSKLSTYHYEWLIKRFSKVFFG